MATVVTGSNAKTKRAERNLRLHGGEICPHYSAAGAARTGALPFGASLSSGDFGGRADSAAADLGTTVPTRAHNTLPPEATYTLVTIVIPKLVPPVSRTSNGGSRTTGGSDAGTSADTVSVAKSAVVKRSTNSMAQSGIELAGESTHFPALAIPSDLPVRSLGERCKFGLGDPILTSRVGEFLNVILRAPTNRRPDCVVKTMNNPPFVILRLGEGSRGATACRPPLNVSLRST